MTGLAEWVGGGFYRVICGLNGFLPGFTGFYRVLPSFLRLFLGFVTGFYRVRLGSLRFGLGSTKFLEWVLHGSRVIPGFTGFYRVFLDFFGFLLGFT